MQCVLYDGPDSEFSNKEICICSNEDTVTVVDVSDKNDMQLISRQSYSGRGYTHQGWLTEDKAYFIFNDETDEFYGVAAKTRTHVMDATNLRDLTYLGFHQGRTSAIDHNLYVKNDLVYQANYRAGLNILRHKGGIKFEELGYFDIFPSSDAPRFNGAWSTFPYYPSEVVTVSGIEQGLFILKVPPPVPTISPAPSKMFSDIPSLAPSPPVTECIGLDVTVSITSDGWPTEISWTIQNDAGAIVASDGGTITQQNTEYINDVCLDSSKCYTFTINDSFGDGIGAPFSLTVDGEVKLSNPNAAFGSLQARFGECAPTVSPTKAPTSAPTGSPTLLCTANETDVTVSITSDGWPTEISWVIQNDAGVNIASDGGAITQQNTEYINDFCLDSSKCYTFTINDSAGDGIGAPFALTVGGDVELSNPYSYFGSLQARFGECAPTVSPTKAPTPAPTGSPTVICTTDELEVTVSITSDLWPYEITWAIQNGAGVNIASDGGTIVEQNTEYINNFCLDSSDCYTFTINDSAKDGIGGPFALTVDGDVKLSNPNNWFGSLNASFGQCATLTLPPSSAPSSSPPQSCICEDTSLRFKVVWNGRLITRDCIWIGNRATIQRCNIEGVKQACPKTCGMCS